MTKKNIVSILIVLLLLVLMAGCGDGGMDMPQSVSGNNGTRLVSITVIPTNPTIAKNTIQEFTATGIYLDNTTKDLTEIVTWSSSDQDVATIALSTDAVMAAPSGNGKGHSYAYGKGAGKTKIKAAFGDTSGETELTVTDATLVSITVTPGNPTIAEGTDQQLTAQGTFSDGTTQDLTTTATWLSSDTGVASISNATGSHGLATSVYAGTTTITAAQGSVSGSTSLTVTPAMLVSITITPTDPSIAKGTTKQFTAMGTFSDDTTQDLMAKVTWSSTNSDVARISSSGLATSVYAGTTTITAAQGSVSGSTSLTVTPAILVSITIVPFNSSIVEGEKQQFTATGTFSDGTTQDLTTTATWVSSDAGVASISNAPGSQGLATSVYAGTTTITAAQGSVSGTATLVVDTAIPGSLTLSWNAPTTNTDGTPLVDLAGFRVYYGTSSRNYTLFIDVGNVTTYTFTDLPPGTYFFSVTASDTLGNESDYSNEASKTIE